MATEEKKTLTEEEKAPVAAKKTAAKKAVKSTKTVKKAPAKKTAKEEVKAEKEVKEAPKATEASAKLTNYGVTPRKVRLVIDLVRGKDLPTAYGILENCPKRCARDIKKLIMSAEANAVNNFHRDHDSLYIASITANDAVRLKRRLPRAKGSASGLIKRWSHVFVTLKNKEAK